MTTPVFKNIPNKCIEKDGKVYWISRSVAVIMIVEAVFKNRNYYAIEKRGTKQDLDSPGLWCLPCGYLDFSEQSGEAGIREVWEEIGLDLTPYLNAPLVQQPWSVKSSPDENRQNVTLRHSVSLGDVRELPILRPNFDCEPNEVADAQWVTSDELGNYNWAFGHDTVITEYINKVLLARYGGFSA